METGGRKTDRLEPGGWETAGQRWTATWRPDPRTATRIGRPSRGVPCRRARSIERPTTAPTTGLTKALETGGCPARAPVFSWHGHAAPPSRRVDERSGTLPSTPGGELRSMWSCGHGVRADAVARVTRVDHHGSTKFIDRDRETNGPPSPNVPVRGTDPLMAASSHAAASHRIGVARPPFGCDSPAAPPPTLGAKAQISSAARGGAVMGGARFMVRMGA